MANLQVGVAGNGTVTVGAGASVHSPANNTLTLGTNSDERLRITSAGDVGIGTDNASCILDAVDTSSSGYIAEFRQVHASNSGQIVIDSPTDSNLRPSYIDLSQAGTVKWSVGQVYASTSSQAFHICAGSSSQANSKLVISTGGQVGVNTSAFTSGSQFESNSEGAYNIIARSHNGNGGYHNFTGQSAGGTNTSYITHNGRGYFEDGVQFDSSGEVLDSYEEGTFTMQFNVESQSNMSMAGRFGVYTKVGRLVTIHGGGEVSGDPAGQASNKAIEFSNLPFTSMNSGVMASPGIVGTVNFNQLGDDAGMSGTGPYTFHVQFYNNSTAGRIVARDSASTPVLCNASLFLSNATQISVTLTYMAA